MSKKKNKKKSNWIGHFGNKKLTEKILSRDAIIVYSPKLKKIVWSNTSGAMLFGGTSIKEFVTAGIKSDHPFLAQVKAAVRQLRGETIHRGFRVVNNGHSRFIQCEIGYIKVGGLGKRKGSKKAIIISATNPVVKNLLENDFAKLVIDNMEDLGPARAICDEYGLTISANGEFAEADLKLDDLEALCSKADDQFEASLEASNGAQADLKLFTLNQDPKRVLVVAETEDVIEEESVAGPGLSTPVLLSGANEIVSESVDHHELGEEEHSEAEQVELNEDSVHEKSEVEEEPEIVQREEEVNEEVEAEEPSQLTNLRFLPERPSEIHQLNDEEQNDDQISIKVDDDTEELIEESSENVENEEVEAELEETVPVEDNSGELAEFPEEFVFKAESEPVRFAWTTNNNQEFTSVSEELAKAVGPNAADIVGRKWSDVATVFGFDNNGDINSLLKKQDTWSGKSVLWPVQGTDLHVPVDLAALPTFSSGRNFDGFRGFGIVRMLDTVVDPDATGMALVGSQRKPSSEASEEPVEEKPETDEQPGSETRLYGANNIVDLSQRRKNGKEDIESEDGDEGELTSKENKAFHEIGQKLRDSSKYGISHLHKDEVQDANGEGEDQSSRHNVTHLADTGRAKGQVDTSILSELPVPVLVFRGDDTLFANQELLNMTGYQSLDQLREAGGLNALFADEEPVDTDHNSEVIFNDIDGGKMKVKAVLKSVPWDGEQAMLLSVRQPKHEQLPDDEKIVLDMMRVSELNNILDTATDGIIILDQEGIVQSVNQSAEALFGRAEADVVEKSINILFAGESHSKIDNLLNDLREANAHRLLNEGCEVIGVEAKGGLIPLFISIGAVGKSGKFCAILRDMTPWKKTREELVEARQQAESASEQKTEFLARISHEIRTPLNAIIGFSDVMIEERFGPIDNERYREYLRDINRSGIHVLDLINDLLDISKIEAGKMELAFEAVDLNQIVGETVALLQPQANGNRVLIRTSLSRAVPKVVADARSIRQIVLNLVSNAIKFTEANGQVIVSTVYEGNGEVALRVRDTGRGMSEEDISIALKPFRQLNAISETRGQGTGLGLPLTKALVEANKAYFDIESEPGEGTIVLIQFPTQRVLAD